MVMLFYLNQLDVKSTLVLSGIGFGKSSLAINGTLNAVPKAIAVPGLRVLIFSIFSGILKYNRDLISSLCCIKSSKLTPLALSALSKYLFSIS